MSKLTVFRMPEFVANNYIPKSSVTDTEECIVNETKKVYFNENKIIIDITCHVGVYDILHTTLEKSKCITKNDSYLYQYELDIKDEGPFFKLVIDDKEYKAKIISLQVFQIIFEII